MKDCSEIVVDGNPITARKVKHWLSRNGVISSRNGVVGWCFIFWQHIDQLARVFLFFQQSLASFPVFIAELDVQLVYATGQHSMHGYSLVYIVYNNFIIQRLIYVRMYLVGGGDRKTSPPLTEIGFSSV